MSTGDDNGDHAVVLCGGRSAVRCGLGGDKVPNVDFPTVVGRWRGPRPTPMLGGRVPETYIGREARAMQSMLDLTSPFAPADGVIADMDDWELLMRYAFFNELRVDAHSHPVLLAEPAMNPESVRARTIATMFEAFNSPACLLEMAPRLALLASGRTHGLVVDAGHGPVRCAAFSEGEGGYPELVAPPSVCAVGGAVVTEELGFRLAESEGSNVHRDVVTDIKEGLCCVTVAGGDAAVAAERPFELPDGTQIACREEHRTAPNILFDPSLQRRVGGNDTGTDTVTALGLGLTDAVASAALSAPDPAAMLANVVLCGGTSLFPGLADRLAKELSPRGAASIVPSSGHARHSDFVGGSLLVARSRMGQMWISKRDYDEVGADIINQQWPGGASQFSSGCSLTKAARG
jgi:actin-related protein